MQTQRKRKEEKSRGATHEGGQHGGGQLWQQPDSLRICAASRAALRRSRRHSKRSSDEQRARARRRPAVASQPEAGLDRPRSRPPEGEHGSGHTWREEKSAKVKKRK